MVNYPLFIQTAIQVHLLKRLGPIQDEYPLTKVSTLLKHSNRQDTRAFLQPTLFRTSPTPRPNLGNSLPYLQLPLQYLSLSGYFPLRLRPLG